MIIVLSICCSNNTHLHLLLGKGNDGIYKLALLLPLREVGWSYPPKMEGAVENGVGINRSSLRRANMHGDFCAASYS